MTENRLILKTAYDLFTGRHSNFGLPLSALSLWVLPREEYLDAFGRACARLGRGVPSSFNQFASARDNFRAELLCTSSKAVILLETSLSRLGEETLQILLHELGHAYCDLENLRQPPLWIPDRAEADWLLYIQGKRMWGEFSAEQLAYDALPDPARFQSAGLPAEFRGLLKDTAVYPERMGFFFFRCHVLHLGENELAEHLQLTEPATVCGPLLSSLSALLECTEARLRSNHFRLWESEFLIHLGALMLDVINHYLAYFDGFERFLFNSRDYDRSEELI